MEEKTTNHRKFKEPLPPHIHTLRYIIDYRVVNTINRRGRIEFCCYRKGRGKGRVPNHCQLYGGEHLLPKK